MKASHFQDVHTSRFRAKKVDFSTRPVPKRADCARPALASPCSTRPAPSPAPTTQSAPSLPRSAQTAHVPTSLARSAQVAPNPVRLQKRASSTQPDPARPQSARPALPPPRCRSAIHAWQPSSRWIRVGNAPTPLSLHVAFAQASTGMRVRSALFFCDGSTSRA